jgi:2,3-bisphosphoglycerate-dependent phosphoglycerate mutase
MKKIFVALMLFATGFVAVGQDKSITTFILVRHAEKDLTQSTSDPDLSSEGRARAATLVNMLQQTEIHAVYTTDYKRTRQTVEPLALSKALAINVYDPRKNTDIDAMLQKHAGSTIVVSGHSNTIPMLANYLMGEEKYRPMEDGEYGNIIIVSVTGRGKQAKVVWLKY